MAAAAGTVAEAVISGSMRLPQPRQRSSWGMLSHQRHQRWRLRPRQHEASPSTRHRPGAALIVESPSEPIPREAAWALLKDFTQKEASGLAQPMLATSQLRRRLRDALLVAASQPEPAAGWNPGIEAPEILLGVVASDIRLACRALRDYCSVLGLPFVPPESRVPGAPSAAAIQGAVYIKYIPSRALCYASRYVGRDRGVLVQLGQCQVGHLPLGLHDEDMAKPMPSL